MKMSILKNLGLPTVSRLLKIVLTALTSVFLVSCGGGNGSGVSSTTGDRALAAITVISNPNVVVTSLTKISETRVSRTLFDYVFTVTFKNADAAAVTNVSAVATIARQGSTVVKGNIFVGDLNPGASVTPVETITIRQDRTFAFESAALMWLITSSSGVTSVPGILLSGNPSNLAINVLRDYSAVRTQNDIATAVNPNGGPDYYQTQVIGTISPTATVALVNDALNSIGAKIVFAGTGSPIVTIQVPNQGDFITLQNLIDSLKKNGAFAKVMPLYDLVPAALPLPIVALDANSPDGPIAHQTAARFPAAWNALHAIPDAASNVEVIIIDSFGGGAVIGTSGSTEGYKMPPDTAGREAHGYHVLGILAGDFGGTGSSVPASSSKIEISTAGGLVTGSLPLNIPIHIIDISKNAPGFIGPFEPWQDYVIRRLRTIFRASPSKNFVLNISRQSCLNPNTACLSEAEAANIGEWWATLVRTIAIDPNDPKTAFPFDDKVLQVSAAGNHQGSAAKLASPFNASVLMGSTPVSGLVVESRDVEIGPTGVIQPTCSSSSFSDIGGNISAVGNNVFSFTGPNTQGRLDGTSMAAPQVSGLAAWMLSIRSNLSIAAVRDKILHNSFPYTNAKCANPAPVIDAYGALLSLDRQLGENVFDAPVRLALLQPLLTTPGGTFDLANAIGILKGIFPSAYTGEAGASSNPSFSKSDLNGDGYSAVRGRQLPFNLRFDEPGATPNFSLLDRYPDGELIKIDEANATDFEVLCYYVHSSLFNTTDLSGFNVELGRISTAIGRTVSCKSSPLSLRVSTTNQGWTGLPADVIISQAPSDLFATTLSNFSFNGDPNNTCGSGERGSPVFSGTVPLTAVFYAVTSVSGFPARLNGPGVNRRPCSSFYATATNNGYTQTWINATGRGVSFGGVAIPDWEYQIRFTDGDAFGAGQLCQVGVVPNSNFFVKDFDAVCTVSKRVPIILE